ncbi:MAG TPA: hypothetical protein VFO16_22865 [Pseudonocardiaceae bacterium]|nr:hypothetical protein [Pseudonocardiaceae bacterium]
MSTMRAMRAMRFVARSSVGVIIAGIVAGFALPATAASPLPYGPDTCKQGFVWREARPSDHVCVTPQNRQITWDENALAASRVQPGNNGYGPNACKSGFVWREAFDGDIVCVTPDRRAQAKLDNSQATQRRASPSSQGDCVINDGKAYTGVSVGSNPTRYQAVYSPYLGARWNSCSHAVTLYIGDYSQGTHYNLLVNGKQRELTGTKGPRQFTLKDSEFAPGTADFAIQGCTRGGGGIFGTDVGRGPSVCTNWSPTVKLVVHLGSSN